MATLFEPSLSSSNMRLPLSAAAPSMADSLPSIEFGFEDLRQRMASFTDRFDDFIAKGRKRVLEERNQFRGNVAELRGRVLHDIVTPLSLLMPNRKPTLTEKGHRDP